MPELPDVEVFRKYFDETALHQKIDHVWVDPGMLEGISKELLTELLVGDAFENSRRHGKHLFAALGKGGWLTFHFGMTGFLKYYKADADQPGHVRMRVSFSNGHHLAFDNQRKFGRIRHTADPRTFITEMDLGPDALSGELTQDIFIRRLLSKRGALKAILMNQSVIAGIGNVYADEILFQAKLHPKKTIADLDDKTFERLYLMMRQVLQEAIDAEADPEKMPSGFLLKTRGTNGACPCGGKMEKISVSGRNGYFCPKCQK